MRVELRPLRKEIAVAMAGDKAHTGVRQFYIRRLDNLGRFAVPTRYLKSLFLPVGCIMRIECDPDEKEIRLSAPIPKTMATPYKVQGVG